MMVMGNIPGGISGQVSRVVRLAAVIAAPAALALGVMAPMGAQAQNAEVRTLNDQMVQVQRELTVLQKHVYQNGEIELAQAPQGNFADIQLRLGDLEERMRDMNGRMEELNHRITTLNDRLDKMSSDIDFRLNNAQPGGAAPGGAMPNNPGPNNSGAASPGGQPPTALTQPAPGAAPVLTPPPGANDPTRPPSQSGFLGTIPVNPSGAPSGAGGAPGQQASAPPAQSAAPAPGKPLPDGSPEDQYNYALSLLRKSDYPGAEAALTAFVALHPSHQLAGNAQYWLGETYYVRNDFNNAARAFAIGFQKYPKSQKGPDNLLKLGLSLGNLNKNKEACQSYSMLKSEFPKAPQEVTRRAEAEQKRLRCG